MKESELGRYNPFPIHRRRRFAAEEAPEALFVAQARAAKRSLVEEALYGYAMRVSTKSVRYITTYSQLSASACGYMVGSLRF